MNLDLAISPCPNDTYIFYHLLQPHFTDHTIQLHLADVEELNRRAIENRRHAITKLSFFAITALQEEYELINSGGALGRGCGPLLISNGEGKLPELLEELRGPKGDQFRVLIPGAWTTANLLTHLFLAHHGIDPNRIRFVPMRYDLILKKLSSGEERLGVIIHEERFTYQRAGLTSLQDLGEWWEQDTKLPIPLGGIAIRRDVPEEVRRHLEEKIRESILLSRKDDAKSAWPFIKENAQALEDDVIRSHIGLYVNDFSLDYGEEGRQAIRALFAKAKEAKILSR